MISDLMADLRKTYRFPTDAEVGVIVREGTLIEVADAMVITCCTNKLLCKQYRKLYAQR